MALAYSVTGKPSGQGRGMVFRIVLIGATGVFGSRIARRLVGDPRMELVLAGRRRSALEVLRGELGVPVEVAELDVLAEDLPGRLAALRPALVIHAAGPFQAQDYRVAEASLACGSHYVDLADGRTFVAGIGVLDAAAREARRVVVSGASSVPALSGAVIDALRPAFGTLLSIECAISPGNRTPRGDATVASILGYCGKPIRVWRAGCWQSAYGWMDGRRQWFASGHRRVGVCEVPDLDLFPVRYPGVRTVLFRAGLELPVLHAGTWVAAALVRIGLVRDLPRHTRWLRRLSERFLRYGSAVGGMVVELAGTDRAGAPRRVRWWLDAAAGDGPDVPATPAVVLAQQLVAGALTETGARPCVGLLGLEALLASLARFAVRTGVDMLDGEASVEEAPRV